jgi:hypothetical protein
MNDLGGAQLFERLSDEEKARYITINQQMVRFARDHAVPVIFAPPLSVGGAVNGATGCILQLRTGVFVVTASHVLARYEERVNDGERLNWQVGKLLPFDPIPRVAWRNERKDIVLLRLRENEVPAIGPCTISTPPKWPPAMPQEGQLVILAGYPGTLREIDPSGWIGAGPFSALFRVTTTGQDYCTCRIEQKDLISFTDTPPPPPGTDMGGISGGPVFLMGDVSYPLVGIITDLGYMEFADLELLRIATFESIGIQ